MTVVFALGDASDGFSAASCWCVAIFASSLPTQVDDGDGVLVATAASETAAAVAT